MFLSIEKELLAHHYLEMKNSDNSTIYRNFDDARIQIALIFHKERDCWSLSFPLADGDLNYITYWKRPSKIREYALEKVLTL